MIKQTQQQRDNTLEMLNVMWPSVPPENVIQHLAFWRNQESRGKPANCATIACAGGWCAVWPNFVAQGVATDSDGMPWMNGLHGCFVGSGLFGCGEIFQIRSLSKLDDGFIGTDHELVTHRLQWLLKNSEVVS